MRKFISDRQLVVILFILVFITFSFAHEDSKQIEQFYSGFKPLPAAEKTAVVNTSPEVNQSASANKKSFTQEASLR